MGQRQLLLFDIPFRESCTRMTLTDKGMALPPLLAQKLRTNDTMTDIRLCPEALDTRGIATEDTNIVEHCGFLQELLIQTELWMGIGNLQATICHLTGVNHQNPP